MKADWELVCTYNPVFQNYKAEPASTQGTFDLLWSTVVTCEEESGVFIFPWSPLQSQVLSASLGAAESDWIFALASHHDDSASQVTGHFQAFVSKKAPLEVYMPSSIYQSSSLSCFNKFPNLQRHLSLWSVYELQETNAGLLSINMTNILFTKMHLSSTRNTPFIFKRDTICKINCCQRLISVYKNKRSLRLLFD